MKQALLATLLVAAAAAAAIPAAGQTPRTLAEATALVEAGRDQDAKAWLVALAAREPTNAAAAYWAGRVLVNTDEPDEAAKHLERAVQREPNNAVYHLWLGRAYGLQAQRAGVLRQAGLARRTKATFERVLALDPANLDARIHLIDFHLIAPGLMGGSKQTALQFAQEIRQRNEWLGLFQLARVQLAMDQRAAAEQTMHTIIRTYPDSASARVQLALHYSNLNRFDYAYETLRPFASGATANRSVMYQMGRLAAVSGQYLDEGEAALRTWLRGPRQPGDLAQPAGHWRLGMILEHRGDTAGARREYEAALAIDPQHAAARDALRRLR